MVSKTTPISNVTLLPRPTGEGSREFMDERRRNAKDLGKAALIIAELHKTAYTDELTGLPNNRQYDESLPILMKEAREAGITLAVIHADVAGLKRANMAGRGHALGDDVLKQVGSGFVDTLRDEDLVGRMHGDEFWAILLDYHPNDGEPVEDHNLRIEKRISDRFSQSMREIGVPDDLYVGLVSAIVTMERDDTPESINQRADLLLSEKQVLQREKLIQQGVVFEGDSRLIS